MCRLWCRCHSNNVSGLTPSSPVTLLGEDRAGGRKSWLVSWGLRSQERSSKSQGKEPVDCGAPHIFLHLMLLSKEMGIRLERHTGSRVWKHLCNLIRPLILKIIHMPVNLTQTFPVFTNSLQHPDCYTNCPLTPPTGTPERRLRVGFLQSAPLHYCPHLINKNKTIGTIFDIPLSFTSFYQLVLLTETPRHTVKTQPSLQLHYSPLFSHFSNLLAMISLEITL